MSQENLIKMANDIAAFFRAEPNREDAIGAIANHIVKFWTPRMREKLAARLQDGDAGLDDLALEAARRVAARDAGKDQGKVSA